ncbi:MAG: hypothetical protein AAFV98_07565 [Chloroflexota bacterium]
MGIPAGRKRKFALAHVDLVFVPVDSPLCQDTRFSTDDQIQERAENFATE